MKLHFTQKNGLKCKRRHVHVQGKYKNHVIEQMSIFG